MPASLTDGLSRDVASKFQFLRKRFVDGLPARWQAIADAGSTAALQDALHRLAGSAGSYGFEQLSHCARAAEQLAAADKPADLVPALAQLAQAMALAQAAASQPDRTDS